MQVALFRSSKFGMRQRGNGRMSTDEQRADDDADSDSDTEKLRIVEDEEDSEINITDNDDDEIEISDSAEEEGGSKDIGHSSATVYIDYDGNNSDVLRFHCHLCSFSVLAQSPSTLASHLNRQHHSDMCRLPAVEILDFDNINPDDGSGGDASPMLLRRCGFCPYESYVGEEFDLHVLSAHQLPRPLRCNLGCMYASFSRLQMHAHFAETHSQDVFSVSPLDKPYSMLPIEEDNAEDNDDIFVTFLPKVMLDDVFEWSDTRFEALLSAHGVWY